MFFRKQVPATPWPQEEEHSKNKESPNRYFISRNIVLFLLFLSAWFLVLFGCFQPRSSTTKPRTYIPSHTAQEAHPNDVKTVTPILKCDGSVSVYVYSLPPEFNVGLLEDCHHLNVYTDMCPHVANCGLGQPLSNMGSTSWFFTHQFIAEMIFHARVENHQCRTLDPERANLFYVPFYGGLHVSSKFREPDLEARDALAVRLIDYLQAQPWWQKRQGKDHFLALGRTAWDFMRRDSGPDFGANSLLNLAPVQNMSVLTVERHPWKKGSNQHGIPYPSYFHPSTSDDLLTWQNNMMMSERPHLWSFIGGPRKGLEKAAIREKIIGQCTESTRCHLVKCGSGANQCYQPSEVLSVMRRSQFCLQAAGDSYTTRSTFDSVLAGCCTRCSFRPTRLIPQWYLP
ncbi:hypothetical protein CJ030_MR5G022586 [Morella rubra]|uniref:Exostosin GT47 domain-containing protein n=1 Tax=Morella rubra TaxID=262757 RepID=A0A6A1VIA6_9ROSI|nr:hypothetical protein CJ030_MR5G022586 [Morella rubra]